MSERKRSGGRPSKGDRFKKLLRFPRPVATGMPVAAAEAGYDNVNDWLADLAAVAQGQPPTYGDAEQLLAQLDAATSKVRREGQLRLSA